MELYQIKNDIKKAFQKAGCSNSPLGKGRRHAELLKLEEYVMQQIDAISEL